MTQSIKVNARAQGRNDEIAKQNRSFFLEKNIVVFNLISSPGSGKTSLLESMAKYFGKTLGVITGDIQMDYDAKRIDSAGAQAIQIETGGSCHLNAAMVRDACAIMDFSQIKLLVIENVGNLVCPSTFDLGEQFKVAMLSVTEGDEKVAKYPALFSRSKALIISKIDLLPHVTFSKERAQNDCKKLSPDIEFFEISCKTQDGMENWIRYCKGLINK